MKLNVLIVDDDTDLLGRLEKQWERDEAVNLHLASSEEEGLQLLDQHVFVLCFVDLRLDPSQKNVLGGVGVLEAASTSQSVAHLYAMTAYPSLSYTQSAILGRLLDPTATVSRRLRGLVDKTTQNVDQVLYSLIAQRADVLARNAVSVNDDAVSHVVDRLSQTGKIQAWSEMTEEARKGETEHVIALLFGQGREFDNPLSNKAQRHVEIREFADVSYETGGHTGNSGAAVYLARSQLASGLHGDWVVLKFASKELIKSEVGRYELFVRFDSQAQHRVELLGWTYGNHLGALSYSLASSNPESVKTLKGPIKNELDGAIAAVATLFSEDRRHWHSTPAGESNPSIFLLEEYDFRVGNSLVSFHKSIDAAVKRRNSSVGRSNVSWHKEADGVKPSDQALARMPTDDTIAALQRFTPGCISHGDTHAANVVFNDSSDVRLIDYATTGPSPRCVDFASIEASQRVVQAESLNPDEALRLSRLEHELWRTLWDNDEAEMNPKWPFWMRFSFAVTRCLQATFTTADAGPVTEFEYAQLVVLHGTRIHPAWWVDDNASGAKVLKDAIRLRLVSWMSPAVEALS